MASGSSTVVRVREVVVPVILGALGAIGACVGSFLNVVAYRLPRECMSIVRPASRCPRCTQPIAGYDNVPTSRGFGCAESAVAVAYPSRSATRQLSF